MSPVRFVRSRSYPVEPTDAYDRFVALPVTEIFARRHGPLPPIVEVREQGETFDEVGQSRVLVLQGGDTMRETLVEVDRPEVFSYQITELTGALKPLVSTVDGTWRFEPEGTGVRITWTWTLHPRNGFAARVLPLIGRFWQGFAGKGFEELEHLLLR